jgi:hypothetical protein
MTEELEVTATEEELTLETIHDYYDYLKTAVASLEADVLKSAKGNKAAGVRIRKSLRHIKSHAGDFIKFTLGK